MITAKNNRIPVRKYRASAGVDDNSVTHIGFNPTGFDGTLCGIADEGIGDSVEVAFDETEGTIRGITCEQCIAVVDFCKAL